MRRKRKNKRGHGTFKEEEKGREGGKIRKRKKRKKT